MVHTYVGSYVHIHKHAYNFLIALIVHRTMYVHIILLYCVASFSYIKLFNYLICYVHVDLCKFLLCCTGSQDVVCNHITIQFTNDQLAPAIKANTCSRELTLSLLISPPSELPQALKAILNGDSFTTL